MRALPERCAQCVVTSPPYWGLRDYGTAPVAWADGTTAVLGLEPTPEEFIAHLVEVFRDVRCVLRDDGTLFVNMGDSYAADGKWGGTTGGMQSYLPDNDRKLCGRQKRLTGLQSGNLCNIPHRVAAALQADGWHWRSTIVWAKRSPMPESISGWRWRRCRVKLKSQDYREYRQPGKVSSAETTGGHRNRDAIGGVWLGGAEFAICPGCDKCRPNGGYVLRRGKWRPTTAHEYIFLFSKSERYFCDGDAVQEMTTGGTHHRGKKMRPPKEQAQSADGNGHGDWCITTPDLVENRNPRFRLDALQRAVQGQPLCNLSQRVCEAVRRGRDQLGWLLPAVRGMLRAGD